MLPGIWETRDIAFAEEVCKALVRIPAMTHVQIADLLGIWKQQAFRMVKHMYDSFTVQPYVREKHHSERYKGGHGLMSYVRLTRDAAREWGERERISPRNVIRSNELLRYIATMDVLIGLRKAGLLYDEWDMTLPQDFGASPFHAVLKHIQSGFKLGVYLLPHKYIGDKAKRKLNVIHGTIRQVDQKRTVGASLFLIPRRYYADGLRMILRLKNVGSKTYLLPLESFIEKPRYFLWAIRLGEQWYMEQLLESLQPEETMTPPVQHKYPVVARFDERLYRLLDTYVAGDPQRLDIWLPASSNNQPGLGFHVPGTGSVASASVYVFDPTMQQALADLAEQKQKDIRFLPWPIDHEAEDEDEDGENYS